MKKWKYLKGDESDFVGAPEWALYCAQVKSFGSLLEAWEGENNRYCYTPRSGGDSAPLIENKGGGFINWSWSNKVEVIAQRQLIDAHAPFDEQDLNDCIGSTESLIAERGSRYGKFKDGADIMQSLKDVMREVDGWNNLTASQKEALDMIQHKVGRILNGDPNYDDSWKDIAGYATLIANELNGEIK